MKILIYRETAHLIVIYITLLSHFFRWSSFVICHQFDYGSVLCVWSNCPLCCVSNCMLVVLVWGGCDLDNGRLWWCVVLHWWKISPDSPLICAGLTAVRYVIVWWTEYWRYYNSAVISYFTPIGWLHKEMKSGAKSTSLKLKKRWFVLTTNSLDYYKSSERSASKLGTLVLNSLCSVVQPDEKVFKDTGQLKLTSVSS